MSIIQGSAMQGASRSFYPFGISNSLRFNDAKLTKTFGTPTNQNKWTWSAWVKYSTASSDTTLFSSYDGSDTSNRALISFDGGLNLGFTNFTGGTRTRLIASAKFRDSASWYNIVVEFDSTQSTESNRTKIYVNGQEITAFSPSEYIAQNQSEINKDGEPHQIGAHGSGSFFPGYLAEVNFIDGTPLDKDSFGETKEGIWIPKDTSGLTFGNNGFRLQFKNSSVGSASSSTVGADTSGNNNHFDSSSGFATTDNMTDSPTDNHCVMSPITTAEGQAQSTLSEGNLKVDLGTPSTTVAHTYGTIAIPASGKYFFEGTFSNVSGGPRIGISVVRTSANQSRYVYVSSGVKIVNTTGSSYGASYSASDVIGVAVNVDDNEITFFKNGSTQGAFTIDLTLSTGGSSSDYFPFITNGSGTSTSVVEFNFGARGFAHTPPSGFVALSTANLPDPAIDPAQGENPTEYFNTLSETGNTATSRAFTGAGFQPDWLWSKSRSATRSHALFDSVRGVTKYIAADSTADELSSPSSGFLSSFDADGFTATQGSSNFQNLNNNGETYVYWLWRAGTSFSNSAGSNDATINSSGSVSVEAGFSIVSYTGDGNDNAKFFHGLTRAPELVILKDRDNNSTNWRVGVTALDSSYDQVLNLNLSNQAASASTIFSAVAPTANVITLGTEADANGSGRKFICYCFASREGYSKIGKYDDNVIGSDYENTSPFVYTGFRPAWLMIKGTSAGRDWVIYDNKRTPDDGVYLRANESGTEQTDATNHDISFLSNGFKIRGGSGDINTTNESYIYMAFADQPLKFANGGTE